MHTPVARLFRLAFVALIGMAALPVSAQRAPMGSSASTPSRGFDVERAELVW